MKDIFENRNFTTNIDYFGCILSAFLLVIAISFMYFFNWEIFERLSSTPLADATINTALLVSSAFFLTKAFSTNTPRRLSKLPIIFLIFFVLIFPTVLYDKAYVIALFFISLGYCQIFQFSYTRHLKGAILLSSMAITTASFFVPQSIFYISIVFCALYIFASFDIRNYIIPFIGFAIVYVLFYSYQIFFANNDISIFLSFKFPNYFAEPETLYNNKAQYIYMIVSASLLIIALLTYFKEAISTGGLLQKEFLLDLALVVISLFIVVRYYYNSFFVVFGMIPFIILFSKQVLHSKFIIIFSAMMWIMLIIASLSIAGINLGL